MCVDIQGWCRLERIRVTKTSSSSCSAQKLKGTVVVLDYILLGLEKYIRYTITMRWTLFLL